MYKVQIDGPFSKTQAVEFIEDIANTDGYTVTNIELIKNGMLYDVIVCYENGVTSTKKRSVK